MNILDSLHVHLQDAKDTAFNDEQAYPKICHSCTLVQTQTDCLDCMFDSKTAVEKALVEVEQLRPYYEMIKLVKD